jgi:hypothetical protein
MDKEFERRAMIRPAGVSLDTETEAALHRISPPEAEAEPDPPDSPPGPAFRMESELARTIRTAGEQYARLFKETPTPARMAPLSVPDAPTSIGADEMHAARAQLEALVGEGLVVQGQATGSTAATPPNAKVLERTWGWYQAPGTILAKWPRHVEALNEAIAEPWWLAGSIQHRNSLVGMIGGAITHQLGL